MTSQPGKEYKVHGNKGVYCGGDWLDIEDCDKWVGSGSCGDSAQQACRARNTKHKSNGSYDVVIIGAGCIGSAIARELSKYNCAVLLLERDDDVTQGATKGNSGIVHAGYDDKPGSKHAEFCWPGNQMFAELDKDLKFGFLKNGSLVLARGKAEEKVLDELMERGRKNGVKNLRIVKKAEVHEMEPYLDPNVTAALYSPDAGTVIPYEFAIALAENAADNGVDVKIRHQVTGIETVDGGGYVVNALNWGPDVAVDENTHAVTGSALVGAGWVLALLLLQIVGTFTVGRMAGITTVALIIVGVVFTVSKSKRGESNAKIDPSAPHPTLAFAPGNDGKSVSFKTKYVVNCAGLFSDKVANMVGDYSFKIKPRLGDYILLHKNQGHLASRTLFPCPDPVLGKGVLVQTTLWGNLILGPTARDINIPEKLNMSNKEIMEYILVECRKLVPSFDAGQVIHSFCGARAKSDRGDWIIEESQVAKGFYHAAGIDSPGLAGSPAIALEIVKLLGEGGLSRKRFKEFNPNRTPLIVPKNNWKTMNGEALKVFKEGKQVPSHQNVICKCEKVTEEEIVRAVHSSLEVDNTQAVRRRTRAGMGHCQAGEHPHCEQRVAEIIAREKKIKLATVGRRPWPATSLLPQRWITDDQRDWIRSLVR